MCKVTRVGTTCAALVAILAGGCGPKTDRLEITGQVIFDGAPLNEGSIRFSSRGDSPMSAGCLIRDGSYRIPAEKGLLPGAYAVVIRSPDNDAPTIFYDGVPTVPDRIPEKYNAQSELEVQVVRGEDNHFEFEIPGKGG